MVRSLGRLAAPADRLTSCEEALPERPDRVTGSMERYYKEFGCANDIEKLVESDFRRIKQQVTVEMEYEDMA